MKTHTINTYSLQEMKELFPESYKKIVDNWKVYASITPIPWEGEIIDSLKATINVFNSKMITYDIYPYEHSFIKIELSEIPDKYINTIQYVEGVLSDLGYEKKDGAFQFPGLCKLTGVSFDEDFLEHVYRGVSSGKSLKGALESLAGVASRLLEEEMKYQESEEAMVDAWSENEYMENGKELW